MAKLNKLRFPRVDFTTGLASAVDVWGILALKSDEIANRVSSIDADEIAFAMDADALQKDWSWVHEDAIYAASVLLQPGMKHPKVGRLRYMSTTKRRNKTRQVAAVIEEDTPNQ